MLATYINSQAHYARGTPSPYKGLRPLVCNRFQVLFHSPNRGTFHLSLTVLSAIGRYLVFSLMPWSARIHTTFHVCGATLEHPRFTRVFRYRTVTFFGSTFQKIFLTVVIPHRSPNPSQINLTGLGCSPFARHYSGNRFLFLFLCLLRCFSSAGSPLITMCSL